MAQVSTTNEKDHRVEREPANRKAFWIEGISAIEGACHLVNLESDELNAVALYIKEKIEQKS